MNKERKTIGRQLNSQTSMVDPSPAERSQVFTLKTGRKVSFKFVRISSADVSTTTFVNQETNGRDQLALTKESLSPIIKTIKFQQFFACIGAQRGEKIEILDGSRRRAAAIFAHTGLDVMVTNEQLSADEARQLAKDIQTAKEHNLREIGLRLRNLKESGLSQKEIAQLEDMSQAKVTRALQAAAVPQELLSLFPVQSELSFTDYKTLLELSENLSDKNITADQVVESVSEQLNVLAEDDTLADDEVKACILKLIQKASQTLISAPPKDKSVVSSLWTFSEKDKYARKRVKGRALTFEFNRMPKEVLQELEEAINDVLKRNLSE